MSSPPAHQKLTRNSRLLIAISVSMCVLPILPVIVPYYQHQIGLSFQDFLIGEAIFAATMVLMEIPSGWLADIWKRKHVLFLACFTEMIGFVTLLFAFDFWSALLGQIIIGIGLSFSSGTISAMLYDELLHHGREDDYRKLEGKRHGYAMYMTGISAVFGGFLYSYDPFLPIWVTVVACFVAMAFCLSLSEPPRVKQVINISALHDMGAVLYDCFRGNKEIAAILFFVSFMFGATGAGHWMQQPYYIELGIPEIWFGVFAALGFLAGGMGGDLGYKLERWFRPVHILIGLWIVILLCWVLSAAVLWYHALILLMISNAAYGVGWPVVNDAINRRVDSSRRATYLSVASLLRRLVFVPLGFIIGWVVDDYGVQVGLLALAGFLLVANIGNVRRLTK